MGGNSDADDILRAAIERQPLFRELEDGGLTRAEVQTTLNVSRSTAHRIINRFESMGVIDHEDGRYRLTPLGNVVAAETERATRTVAVANRLTPLLETFEAADERVELDVFDDASVTAPEPADPYLPLRRLLSLVEETSRIRELSPTTPEPAYQSVLLERVRDGLEAAVVYPASVVDHLRRQANTDLQAVVDDHGLDLRVGPLPGFRLILADEHVYLGGYNDASTQLTVVADTDSPAAVEWAMRVFRTRWENATPYAEYVAHGDTES
jgi:predicted transcriptional regulator